LSERFPDHRLIVFSDPENLVSAVSGELAAWVTQLSSWSSRTIIRSRGQMGREDRLLAKAGFAVISNDAEGLASLTAILAGDVPVTRAVESHADYPDLLKGGWARWVARSAPDSATMA